MNGNFSKHLRRRKPKIRGALENISIITSPTEHTVMKQSRHTSGRPTPVYYIAMKLAFDGFDSNAFMGSLKSQITHTFGLPGREC